MSLSFHKEPLFKPMPAASETDRKRAAWVTGSLAPLRLEYDLAELLAIVHVLLGRAELCKRKHTVDHRL